jgi:glycine betaine/proline transport system substrate-binding protein
MPAQKRFVEPLTASGDLVVLHQNLEQIRFTLAVPKYVADAGVASFADLAKNAEKFDKKIYGIEPGAPANQNIQKMITAKQFGLDGWTLVESSEQAMLSQVQHKIRTKEPVVFFGWRPHPMNINIPMAYLENGNDVFGPNDGGATVVTLVRHGYATECPNVGRLLANLVFTTAMEDQLMSDILDKGMQPEAAATAWMKQNPAVVERWLDGVTTLDGKPGAGAVKSGLGL